MTREERKARLYAEYEAVQKAIEALDAKGLQALLDHDIVTYLRCARACLEAMAAFVDTLEEIVRQSRE